MVVAANLSDRIDIIFDGLIFLSFLSYLGNTHTVFDAFRLSTSLEVNL